MSNTSSIRVGGHLDHDRIRAWAPAYGLHTVIQIAIDDDSVLCLKRTA